MSKVFICQCFYFIQIGIIICIQNYSFSQSKKEQIQILSTRLDSLKTVQSSENLSYIKRKTELESSISNFDQRSSELLNTLSTKKENLQNQILENKELEKDILALKLELKSIEDSIQKMLDDQPIKFLESSLINKSDEETIQLFNISLSNIDHEGCNTFEKFTVLGEQNFISAKDTFCCVVLGAICKEKIGPVSGTNFIGLFEFSNGNYKNIFSTEVKGSYGYGTSAQLEGFKKIGSKNFVVILNSGYNGHGQSIEDRLFYKINKSKIEMIRIGEGEGILGKKHECFGGINCNNFEGFTEWKIKFLESNKEFFDLEVVEKESNKSKVKTTILKFNENTMRYE
jgi:hypothetical protein